MRERLTAALLGGGLDDTALVTGLYRRARVQAAPTRVGQIRMLVTKPFEYGRKWAGFVRAHGSALEAQFGAGRVRQFVALYRSWLSGAAHPDPFAAYWAFAGRRARRKWGAWLGPVQSHVLLGDLALRRAPDLARSIGDKRRFPAWALEHGLPIEPLLAVFEDGAPRIGSAEACAAALPHIDLFAKPADYWSGYGAKRWLAGSAGHWTDQEGRAVTSREIVAALMEQSRERPIVLQRCLRPHPSMKFLTPGAVSTIRVVTYQDVPG
ncbi:MAG TPA: sugar-transfer associated ATP-grasp domain-containing protein, partial [Gemmatimonadales bacterium]|nr:sugar-transfer associated ATP-grasp domain-containing protein [Gemmatimonadales bacterium]